MNYYECFSLSYEELRLGENVTTEQFNRRYRPHMAQAVRGRDIERAGQNEVGGNSGEGSERMAGINSQACSEWA